MQRKEFQFPFSQRTSFDKPVCSICYMSIANGARYGVRAGHKVHSHCSIEFDVVEDARKDLSAVFAKMPKQFFEGSMLVERLNKIFTKDGLRGLLLSLADIIREKKDMLRQMMSAKYAEIKAQLCAAANHIHLGHQIASALA